MSGFSFEGENKLVLKTLFTQEMLKRGYLASTSCYLCTSHTEEIIEKYIEAMNEVFELIRKELDIGNIEGLLEGPVCHSGFKRLN